MIVVVDNKGQYVHRIWRSLKYLGEDARIVPNTIPVGEIESMRPQGIVLSGGPYSVYSDESQLGNYKELLSMDLPILGICLGHQIIATHFGGKVAAGKTAEYAKICITVDDEDDLFAYLGKNIDVWESHKDEVVVMPYDFKLLAHSDMCMVEAMKHVKKPIYGLQFHPEVHHTPDGESILKNFVGICRKYEKG